MQKLVGMTSRPTWYLVALVALPTALASTFSCASSDDAADGFVSDDPNGAGDDGIFGSDDNGSSSGMGGSGGSSTGTETGQGGGAEQSPEKIIAEADIIQLDGGILYALSEYSGLSIIDISVPDQLQLLGRQALPGRPFEMYLRDGVVYAMFSGWGRYTDVGNGWQWIETSHVEALDVSQAASIRSLGSFDLPGTLADSRMVGDVVYVVTFEDGYCWDCSALPNTTVTSLAVADPAQIGVVDRLTFEDPDDPWGAWQRSIHVTSDRMYVGNVNWSGDDSTIQVVDISDPAGALVLGDSVDVIGHIESRWQMSEHDGVLRVVSQPWNPNVFPRVETFTIHSSFDLSPLGETELVLPQPEALRAVRFDGTRAFAITAEVNYGDPLYTIDLSDPANPQQMGMLEMPGWVYHIEPMGDQLLALGFDEQHPDGSLNVSLFDVSDMTQPTLVKRVAFGGNWSNFAEDQDRIHKAFKILPDLGLLLVPYSAWEWDGGGCSSYQSGIQMVDFDGQDLTLRGVAPIRGDARRAFVHEGRLFAMSDEQLRAFDIADRDAPAETAELPLASHVSQVTVSGDLVVRMAADWWTSEPRLEVVPASDPARIEPIGSVDLGAMLAEAEEDDSCYYWSSWDTRLYVDGDHVMIVWPSPWNTKARVVVVDLSEPTEPRLGKHIDVPVDVRSYYGYYWGYAPSLLAAGDPVAQIGSTLVFLNTDVPLDDWGYPIHEPTLGSSHHASLKVLNLSDPDAPTVSAQLPLPSGGGHTGLVAQGSQVLLSHWEPIVNQPGKARFYLDRVDLTFPAAPALLEPINVPGSLVSFDPTSSNLLTVDYDRIHLDNVSWERCYQLFGYNAEFEPNNPDFWETGESWDQQLGRCTMMRRHLKLTHVDLAAASASLIDQDTLADNINASRLLVADDRVFFTSSSYSYDYTTSDSYVWAIGGMRAGVLAVRATPVEQNQPWSWIYPVEAEGHRLIAEGQGTVVSVDASDMDDITFRTHGDVPWYVQSAVIDGDRALLSLGSYGLQVVELSD